MSSINDPIIRRTLFYETNHRDNVLRMRFLPFYSVAVATNEGGGKMFEPVDCMRRLTPTSVIGGFKDVHLIQEFDGRAKMLNCEKKPDGKELQLHRFDWDWPLA